MIDREKVIKGLEWLLDNMIDTLNDFMFSGYDGPVVLANKPIIEDTLALLKAQEPKLPAVDAVPVTWLNERHRKCCEEGDADLMDAITVLCNEYHVWQKEQEAHGT